MEKRYCLFFGLYMILLQAVFSQTGPPAQGRPAYRPAKMLLKASVFGSFGKGYAVNDRFAGFFGFEWAFARKTSLNVGAEMPYTLSMFDRRLFAEIRQYFGKPIANGRFSGSYLAPILYFSGRKPNGSEMAFEDFRYPRNRRAYELANGFGLRYGHQVFGLLDFGIVGGLNNAIEKLKPIDQVRFAVKSASLPYLRSYFRFHVPLAIAGEGAFGQILTSGANSGKMLKLGLNDLFDFSKEGIYFNPGLAYEQGFGRRWSVNLETQFSFARFRAFDLLNDSVIDFSDRKYLNQDLSFLAKLQARCYAVRFKDDILGEALQLEGIYVGFSGNYRTHSRETFRQHWSFDKSNGAGLGLELGLQKSFGPNYLVDLGIGYDICLYDSKERYNYSFLAGGLHFYWTPELKK